MQAPAMAAKSAFRLRFEDLLAKAPSGTPRHYDFVRVPSNQKPWLDTGIDLAAGETVTTIGSGQTLLTGTPLSFGADFQLWYRIGPDGRGVPRHPRDQQFHGGDAGQALCRELFPRRMVDADRRSRHARRSLSGRHRRSRHADPALAGRAARRAEAARRPRRCRSISSRWRSTGC